MTYNLYEIKEENIAEFEKPEEIHEEIKRLKKANPNRKFRIRKVQSEPKSSPTQTLKDKIGQAIKR